MKQARKLRALVIHDTKFDDESPEGILGTDDLDLFDLELGVAHKEKYLSSWPDVVRFVKRLTPTNEAPPPYLDPPDLLLVDCHFIDDTRSPRLPPPPPGQRIVDPRGLAYGAVLSAHFLGASPRQPFAFVPYSSSMGQASNDPYAQTFYSLLSAMFDPLPELIEPAYYSRAMAATKASKNPDSVITVLLKRYRSILLKGFSDYLSPVTETFERCLQAVDAFVEKDEPIDPELSLCWRAKGKKEYIYLRSLFADCRDGQQWIKDAGERKDRERYSSIEEARMREFLKEVTEYRRRSLYLLDLAGKAIEASERKVVYKWEKTKHAKAQRILTLTIAWALNRCEVNFRNGKGEPVGVSQLERRLGIDPTQVNRTLGEMLGPKGSRFEGSDFIEALDSSKEWPFVGLDWLRDLTVKYLKKRYERQAKEKPSLAPKNWPDSLKETARTQFE